ncbi:MAG: GNAT family N-acetyltransferase [Oscillospiraceae bacterium]|nr:GNAT family N-acetyltransferase [Oscillospiraceae bacterium]
MIRLIEVNEDNWMAFAALRVREEQKGYLDSAVGILARGYAYRACRASVYGIAEGGKAVGLALVKDLDEEPACYDLQQFMIDGAHQGRGFGTEALGLILAELEKEQKYPCVEVCVKRENAAALRLFEKLGFKDTGYIDPDVPDAVNLMYHFN